jgi:fimbrial isopeptide formation D2 family protein/LPXTG-motif cell wall-anchored protein
MKGHFVMKHFKRAAAMLLAVVLSLCLAVTAFAADTEQKTGSLTVTGSGMWNPSESKGKEVTAIRMFTARVTGDATVDPAQKNEFDSYVLEKAWEEFFKQADVFQAMKTANIITSDADSSTITTEALSDAAVAYVKSLKNDETTNVGTLATFAHDAQKWVRAHADGFNELIKNANAQLVSGDADKTMGTANFDSLTAGYYLVFPEGGSTGKNSRGTDAILVNVPRDGGNTAVNIKSTFPTVDKKVQTTKDVTFTDNGTAQVGDKVTFQLTAEVPDMSDYTKYTFKFVDTMTKGLDFVDGSVKVTIADKNIDAGDNTYKVNFDTVQKVLTVTFDNLKKVNKEENTPVATGDKIVVTYEAYINKDASRTDPATNKVYLQYSNNPGTDELGKSNPDESKVYTYDIEIHKFHTEDIDANRLANATFKLTSDVDGNNVVKLVAETDANAYHVQGDGETGVDTVTTDGTGKINIKGLKDGTYYLHETIAPTGYNKLKKPIKIDITVTGEAYTTPTYKVDEVDQNTSNIIKVENVKGVMLPETGSIGTIGLTALGVAVVLLGVFAPRKKKKENQ